MSESIYRELINRVIDALLPRKIYRVESIFLNLISLAKSDEAEINVDTAKTFIRRRIWNGAQGGLKRGKARNPEYDRLYAVPDGRVCRIDPDGLEETIRWVATLGLSSGAGNKKRLDAHGNMAVGNDRQIDPDNESQPEFDDDDEWEAEDDPEPDAIGNSEPNAGEARESRAEEMREGSNLEVHPGVIGVPTPVPDGELDPGRMHHAVPEPVDAQAMAAPPLTEAPGGSPLERSRSVRSTVRQGGRFQPASMAGRTRPSYDNSGLLRTTDCDCPACRTHIPSTWSYPPRLYSAHCEHTLRQCCVHRVGCTRRCGCAPCVPQCFHDTGRCGTCHPLYGSVLANRPPRDASRPRGVRRYLLVPIP